MELEGILPSEIRERQILYDITYVWTEKAGLTETESSRVVARD